jgi:hypothetical protein
MKESHDEGPASHIDPESCGGAPEGAAEALTGAHTGQPSSCEISCSGVPTLLHEAEGNTADGAKCKPPTDPAQSQNLKEGQSFRRMCGNSLHGNRDTSRSPAGDGPAGRSVKADGRTADMHGRGESDDRVVPEQAANRKGTFRERPSARRRASTRRRPGEGDQLRETRRRPPRSGLRAGQPCRSDCNACVTWPDGRVYAKHPR